MSDLPVGTVTFLFTDLEGSTRLWEDDPDAMRAAMARHDALLDDAMRLTAAISHEDDWYVARCLEVEVTSQGRTVDEARANLAETLGLYFEDEPGFELPEPLIITPVDVPA